MANSNIHDARLQDTTPAGADDGAEALLNAHLRGYSALEERALSLARTQPDAGAAYAQMAGNLAWLNHTGLFAGPRLEQMLRVLSERAPSLGAPSGRPPSRAGPELRVLHILTSAYATGGHTRHALRWIEQDQGRRHAVCLTRQEGRPVPAMLVAAVRRSGAGLTLLDQRPGGLLHRAARLRALLREADMVLVHAHPYDVVPILARGPEAALPPFVYVNHADHVFWLGVGAASALLNLRDSGRRLAIERRGVEPSRCAVLARPLGTVSERSLSRETAKERLGIDPSKVVIFTAAAASKYESFAPPSFLDLVTPVLQRHPGAILLAAGPANTGEWAAAAERTGGRVVALGRRSAIDHLHAAADIYVDSYPFASLTSLTEAACCGVPLVAFRGHPESAAVLGADAPGLDGNMFEPADVSAFGATLDALIDDQAMRRRAGHQTRAAVLDTHVGVAWQAGCAALYDLAAGLASQPLVGVARRETGELDRLVLRLQERTGWSAGLRGTLQDHCAILPARHRLPAWITARRGGAALSPRLLLPEWLTTLARVGRRRIRRR
jgi:hypothetical protein